jgi:plasmid replication initiation protein
LNFNGGTIVKYELDLKGNKPNDFILAGQRLTPLQHKALLSMLTKFKFDAQAHHTPKMLTELADIEYTIPLSDIVADYDKYRGGALFKRARAQIEGLMAQSIRIDNGNKLRNYNLVSYSEIDTGTSYIKAKFNHDVIPVLVAMVERGYTELSLTYVRQLKSSYSIRIYELLMKNRKLSHVKKNGYTVTVTLLRYLLGLEEDVYPLFGDFNRRVLAQADKEINSDKTDLRYKFEKIKLGRKVTHIRFYDIRIIDGGDDQSSDEDIEFTEIDVDSPLQFINKKDAVWISNTHTTEYIEYYYKRSRRLERAGTVKSFDGFFFKQLKDDPKDFYNIPKAKKRTSSAEVPEKTLKELTDEALILFVELDMDEQNRRVEIERAHTLFTDDETLRRQAALNYVNEKQ